MKSNHNKISMRFVVTSLCLGLCLAPEAAAAAGDLLLEVGNPDPGPPLNAAGQVNDQFGIRVAALGNDFVTIAIGDDSGGVLDAGAGYLIDGVTGSLIRRIENPTPSLFERFGTSIAPVGPNILVGAQQARTPEETGEAYLFDGATGALLLTLSGAAMADNFGAAVAALGTDMLVGAPGVNSPGVTNAGAVHLFDGVTGVLKFTIPNPDPENFDQFGNVVAGLGGNILVAAQRDNPGGADSAGSVYLFDGTTGALLFKIPNPEPAPNDLFGNSLTVVGGNILVGNSFDFDLVGSAFLFDGVTGALRRAIRNPNSRPGDFFGSSVAALAGNVAIIGAQGADPGGFNAAGTVYVINVTTGQPLLTIPNPFPEGSDRFGVSVAATEDGNILIGADGDDPFGVGVGTLSPAVGAIFLFEGPTCSNLGDAPPPAQIDLDVYTFSGTEGEDITITLQAVAGGTGPASLFLSDAMTDVQFFLSDRSDLPNEIVTTLPATGEYRVAVVELPAFVLVPGPRFRGDYCLTLEGSQGAAQTLAPTTSVEGAGGTPSPGGPVRRPALLDDQSPVKRRKWNDTRRAPRRGDSDDE